MTFRLVSVFAMRNIYVPAGRVIPGSATGRLNVKYVRLSDVNALAPLASAQTSTANTAADTYLLTILGLLPTPISRCLPIPARPWKGLRVDGLHRRSPAAIV